MKMEHLVYDRKMHSKFLPSEAITRPRWIPCAAWKEVGKSHVHAVSVLDDQKRFKKDYSDDYHVVKTLWDMLHNCDVFIGHNGDNFDWKIMTARFLYHGLPPPPRSKMFDTLKVARSQFRLEANDLRYLAWFLKVPMQKEEAPDWNLVSTGDKKEITYCQKYNKIDVLVLEHIFNKLKPYSKIRVYSGEEECPVCGSEKYQSRGRDITGKKWRYQCADRSCMHWWTGKPPKSRADLAACS